MWGRLTGKVEWTFKKDCEQRTFTVGRRIAVQLSSLTRLDLTNKENMFFFVGSEAVESKFVKLETVILPPTVSVSSPFIG